MVIDDPVGVDGPGKLLTVNVARSSGSNEALSRELGVAFTYELGAAFSEVVVNVTPSFEESVNLTRSSCPAAPHMPQEHDVARGRVVARDVAEHAPSRAFAWEVGVPETRLSSTTKAGLGKCFVFSQEFAWELSGVPSEEVCSYVYHLCICRGKEGVCMGTQAVPSHDIHLYMYMRDAEKERER